MALLIRIFFCIFVLGFFLYRYIDHQNSLTKLRMEAPLLEKEMRRIEEDNMVLLYEIEVFESPHHLLQLARRPEYDHLCHPYAKEVLLLPSGENR